MSCPCTLIEPFIAAEVEWCISSCGGTPSRCCSRRPSLRETPNDWLCFPSPTRHEARHEDDAVTAISSSRQQISSHLTWERGPRLLEFTVRRPARVGADRSVPRPRAHGTETVPAHRERDRDVTCRRVPLHDVTRRHRRRTESVIATFLKTFPAKVGSDSSSSMNL